MLMDPGSWAAMLTSFKTGFGILGAMKDIRDHALMQQKIGELQDVIMVAQQNAMAAQINALEMGQRITDLQAKLAEAEGWAAEKARYQLKNFGGDTFAYELRPEHAKPGEPIHWLCPTCFDKGEKSIVQTLHTGSTHRVVECRPCKWQITLGRNSDWDN